MSLVIDDLEVFVLVFEDRRRLALDHELGQSKRLATQLLVGLIQVIQI